MILNKLQINSGIKLCHQASRGLFTGTCLLAGHSKWANIRHIKAAKDGEKSLIFSRYARQIRIAIQEGGSANPKMNSKLQSVIDQALNHNMPGSTIQNTLKRYGDGKQIKLIRYIQGFKALGKVYMAGMFFTENVIQTKQHLSGQMKKWPGTGYAECINMFEEKGVVEGVVPEKLRGLDESALQEACTDDAIECGAEDVEIVDIDAKIVSFACNPVELDRITKEISERGYSIDFAGHIFIPNVTIKLTPDELETLDKLKSKLKEIEGVEEFFDNVDRS